MRFFNRPVGRLLRQSSLGLALAFTGVGSFPSVATAQISFQEILAAPDDVQLNLEYARQEVASGRLQQAAAALERLLLLKPNWDSVRLFYGIVLYRLDDLSGAIREFNLLVDRGLSSSQEQERSKYLALATKKDSPIRLSARYTLGMRIDSNPGRLPDDPFFVSIIDEGTDVATTGSARFRAEIDLGGANGNYLFLQTDSYINEFFKTDTADFVSAQVQTGVVLHGANSVITPYFLYGADWLQYENFRNQYGGGVDSSWSLSSQVDFILNGRAVYQDYNLTSYSVIGDLRDGWRKSVEAGLKFRPSDSQSFKLTGRYARKETEFAGYSYKEGKVALESLTLFGEGRYLSLTTSYTHTKYDQADGDLSFITAREDRRFYARAAVGAPLETIFAEADFSLPESISDVVLQLGVSYTHQNSSINRLNHNNWSGDILFTKRISF
ncbi:MAG: surface lipoprotein assembly modifier [Rhizobiaceae bacterium]